MLRENLNEYYDRPPRIPRSLTPPMYPASRTYRDATSTIKVGTEQEQVYPEDATTLLGMDS